MTYHPGPSPESRGGTLNLHKPTEVYTSFWESFGSLDLYKANALLHV